MNNFAIESKQQTQCLEAQKTLLGKSRITRNSAFVGSDVFNFLWKQNLPNYFVNRTRECQLTVLPFLKVIYFFKFWHLSRV